MSADPSDWPAEVCITVVGPSSRADVAIAAAAPCGACAHELAALLGEHAPGPWALAPAIGPPWPSSTTLQDAGVVDGAWLHLVDVARPWLRAPVVGATPPAADPASSRFGTADPLDPVSGARS